MSADNQDAFFILYAHNIPVAGNDGAVIYDLKNSRILRIPLVLLPVLTDMRNMKIKDVKHAYTPHDPDIIDKYVDYFLSEDWGFCTNNPSLYPQLDFNNFDVPCSIYNAIIEFGELAVIAVRQLDEANCKYLELRIKTLSSTKTFSDILDIINISGIIAVTVFIERNAIERGCLNNFIDLVNMNKKIIKIILHDDLETFEVLKNTLSASAISVKNIKKEDIGNFKKNLLINLKFFAESISNHPHRNKKVYINSIGDIFNIPEDNIPLGNINTDKLCEIVESTIYQSKKLRQFDPNEDSCLIFAMNHSSL